MPTPQERVQNAIRFFFDKALPEATSKTFAQLSSPLVHLGSYVRWSGGPVATPAGQSVTPAYAFRTSAALPVANNAPNPAGVTVPADAPLHHLLWTRQVADPTVDDETEIRRVMADLDSFAGLFEQGGAAGGAAPAGGAGGTPPAGGAAPPAGGATPPPAGGAGTPAAGGAGTGTAGGAGSAGSATGRAAA
ncbi:MAG TPA: hypothetical protein VIH93_09775, partial [Thermoanaerobaculia bacterium]